MTWFTADGTRLAWEWLCAFCVEELCGFDPDMGDDVSWKPGTCERCKREITIFTPTEEQ